MFEVGFTELLLIFALALIVLGPEKLPRLASQVGRWVGRARAMARQFREQLEEESILEETSRKSAAQPTQAQAPPPPDTAPTPAPEPAPAPAPAPAPEKYYQPDDDIARSDVSHADAGAEPAPSDPVSPAADHERGT
jgi:sec-independent protein translocase protein TatB